MVHNPSTRRQNNIPNTSSWQELIDPFLQVGKADVESRGDDTALIETAVELDDDFSRTMVINFLEFANVAWTPISSVLQKQKPMQNETRMECFKDVNARGQGEWARSV